MHDLTYDWKIVYCFLALDDWQPKWARLWSSAVLWCEVDAFLLLTVKWLIYGFSCWHVFDCVTMANHHFRNHDNDVDLAAFRRFALLQRQNHAHVADAAGLMAAPRFGAVRAPLREPRFERITVQDSHVLRFVLMSRCRVFCQVNLRLCSFNRLLWRCRRVLLYLITCAKN